MTTSIPIVGLSSNDPVPGHYVSVQFAQGLASSGGTDYAAILIGNCMSGSVVSSSMGTASSAVYGSATPDILDSEQDAINLFGEGSELHCMFRKFRAVNTSTSLFAVAVPESTGAKATGAITFALTGTAPGTARCWVNGEQIDAGILSGDLGSATATAMATSINAISHLPVTAAASGDVLTLTAKQKGLRGNYIPFQAKIFPQVGVGTTVTPGTRTLMSAGTVSDSNVLSLAAIASSRYYYYVSAAEDQTQLVAAAAQMDAGAAPTVGLRQRSIGGANGSSPSAVQTIAIAMNDARCEIAHQLNSDWTPAQLAANCAAVYSLMEQSLGAQSSLNFNSFGQDAASSVFWRVPATLSGDKFSRAQLKSHLNNGVTPITQGSNGKSYLVRRVTTRSLNGANSDYRVRDACKVTVADKFADDLQAQAAARFAGKVIGDDVAKGQKASGNNVVTPQLFRSMVLDLVNTYDDQDLIQDAATTKAGIVVVREPNATTRLSCRVPLKVVDILNSTGTEVDEVSQG